jgi:hypothetical protein
MFVFFFFFLKKGIPKKIFWNTPVSHVYFYTRGILFDTCNLYTRPSRGQMAACISTRGQLAACINYTRPYVSTPHLATWRETHAAKWPRVYSNGYCRHAAIYLVFCSGILGPRLPGMILSLLIWASLWGFLVRTSLGAC